MKETRYFLDPNYPLVAKDTYSGDPEGFNQFFDTIDSRLMLEATPDYLYGHKTPKWLHEAFGDRVKIIFILRNPLNRLESWYKFGQQDGRIPAEESFQTYVMKMFDSHHQSTQPYLALEQGRYYENIKRWFEFFPQDQIEIIFFEELQEKPKELVKTLSSCLNIDPSFYDDFEFKVSNKSFVSRSPKLYKRYLKLVNKLSFALHDSPAIRGLLKPVRQFIDKQFISQKETKKAISTLDTNLLNRLSDYYRQDIEELSIITKIPYSWQENFALKNEY